LEFERKNATTAAAVTTSGPNKTVERKKTEGKKGRGGWCCGQTKEKTHKQLN